MLPFVADTPSEVQPEQSARRSCRTARKVHRRRHAQRARLPADTAVTGLRMTKLLFPFAFCAVAVAQGLDPALTKPPLDSWPTYHGDYSGRRHSTATQITPANVNQLT